MLSKSGFGYFRIYNPVIRAVFRSAQAASIYTENSILYHNYANNSKQVVTTSKGLFEESTTTARIRESFPNTERRRGR